ncbi:zf-TFIIB domain-containing protein [Amylibacter sp. IMCC11727]|uniref:TFIIB-type zinc ribbon-containing protein n=1 Tax=Amylibacter sp. IMCC11727 TaxID=3039851 RepID=UPI00244DE6EF|nr:zf-TFIIB domain-containing protein [Amylibacter sp. IMCC11727]WGI20386.1 zf-TFIIB domain-containing protein [Amylibacter sp. IMCC11727]
MKCPIDGATLSIVYRDEIEIDYCPTCRGVWLDRGELDKLIDRASVSAPAPVHQHIVTQVKEPKKYKKKKKKGLLGEIFDFLD